MSITASTLTDARQVRTRGNLFEALLRLIETRPFEQVTIREIAREAGIGYATFFRHYASKEALLHDLAANQIAELLNQALPVLFSVDSRQSCIALFDYVAERRVLWSALLTGGAATMLKQEFTAQAKRIADAQGPVDGWLPDDLRVTFAVSATVEIIAWWLQQEPGFPVERIAEILDRLVVMPAMTTD
ncbi:TetR/AcrR family transcriptional regulator [Sphingomonas sp. LaA6.9]|uniref:TetR/AcrR family transcriptional regulator n=1 Tax=Sphingomonas sp. LaA6.9 TaxID=2919914 RepID=UPI001F4FE288|nr:TetR/AcrR family transcriptional regulator [Sphingomonas sp. LaA6.9]MCJ8156116.1 TetR/AcrR family transcriptional regulator [Sphingomonas sp. LaA6.9]